MSNAPPTATRSYVNLQPGDPAPWFYQNSSSNPRYAFDSAAGRYIVLCFYVTAADAQGASTIAAVLKNRKLFDDNKICFFGVSIDPSDVSQARVAESMPGLRYFWDFDGVVSKLYGAIPQDARADEGGVPARRVWMVLDPTLRVLKVLPFEDDGSEQKILWSYLKALPPVNQFAGIELQAPVLFLPNVFEPEFCQHLINLYKEKGGEDSGFMREENGKTVAVIDYAHKRRRDILIEDEALITQTQNRIQRRIVPEILKVHQYLVTRMERYIVCCYSDEDKGHFRAHRDNTTKGTAHRRFAVSINLNNNFEGGEIGFPEYGSRRFKPPVGGAVVFSCSLLHEVSPVTKGERFAFLPFLYDDAAAKIRLENNKYLGEDVGSYQIEPDKKP